MFSENLGIDISIAIDNYAGDKHAAGKQALEKTKYSDNGYTSISHSRNFAVGVSTPKKNHVLGIGVDFEEPRSITLGASKMFLTPNEMEKFKSVNKEKLLELWTIKEALFKATPANNGLFLRNFETTLENGHPGRAICLLKPELEFTYESAILPQGILTVALCFEMKSKESNA